METKELTHEEKIQTDGGNVIQWIASTVDTICDVIDNGQNDGSFRPFQAFE